MVGAPALSRYLPGPTPTSARIAAPRRVLPTVKMSSGCSRAQGGRRDTHLRVQFDGVELLASPQDQKRLVHLVRIVVPPADVA